MNKLNKLKLIIRKNKYLYRFIVFLINLKIKFIFILKNWKYDWKKYWEERWKKFINEDYQKWIYEQHYWILDKIRLYKPKKILEIWCWFGRNIKFIKDNIDFDVEIVWIDISENLINEAKKFLKNYDNINLKVSDILILNENEKFDLILIHWVFMHISFKDFIKNRDKLYRLNFKNLIEVEEIVLNQKWIIKKENINWFTFSHNYLNLDENIIEYSINNNLIYLDIKHV